MEYIKFAVYDSKLKTSLPPFFSPNVPTALRRWHYTCNQEGSDFHNYPGDYTLFELGVYEADTMEEVQHDTKINHGLALIQIEEK